MRFSKALYRARQVLHALWPRLDDGHHEQARSLLSKSEMALFLSMESRDQRHGLRVLDHLTAAGETDRHLLEAALLHDCGKGRVPIWLRVLYVAWPSYVEKLAGQGKPRPRYRTSDAAPASRTGAGDPIREAAFRLVNHPALGAELAAAAGANAATVRYINGRVAEQHEHDKISLLRAADDRS